MYGSGFGPEGSDECTPSSGYDRSFVYRIDTRQLIDRAYRVGSVPKVVAVTTDDRFALVSNGVVGTQRRQHEARSRGEADPDRRLPARDRSLTEGNAAFVAVMGGSHLVRVDLRTWRDVRRLRSARAREHSVFHPTLRQTSRPLNAEGRVARL